MIRPDVSLVPWSQKGLSRLGCQDSYIRGTVPSEYTITVSDGETQHSLLGVERDGKNMEGVQIGLDDPKYCCVGLYANAS